MKESALSRETQSGQEAGTEGAWDTDETSQSANLFDQRRLAQPRIQPPEPERFPTVPYLGPVAPPPVEPPPVPLVRQYAGRLLLLAAVLVLMVIAAVSAIQSL